MRLGLGADVTRAGVNETITGLWTFANVLGFLTDVIGERSAGVGVTVDGLLIRDSGIPVAAVTAHEAALSILETQIPDGALLARLADAETVAGVWTHSAELIADGVLNLGDDIELSERTASLGTGPANDVATGTATVQLLSATGTPTSVSGFAGGRTGRLMMVHNDGGNDWTMMHEGVGSVAANRIALPNSASVLLTDNEAVMLWYDNTASRWKSMAWAHI